jgi:H+-transporting ATPase
VDSFQEQKASEKGESYQAKSNQTMSSNRKDKGEKAEKLDLEDTEEEDFDVEEANGLPSSRPPRPSRHDRRTVSDMILLMNLPEEARHQRVRQKSSNDVVYRSNENAFFQADLRMAEAVQEQGTLRERRRKRVSEEELEMVFEEKEGFEAPDDFVFNHTGFTSQEAAELLVKYGKNELPDKSDPKWLIFLRQFWAPMPIMIWIAIIIEAAIKNFLDMGILLFIQFANAGISYYETTKAGDAVAALKSSLKPSATCKRDGKWAVVDATLIVPGDLVLLASGSAIPADCRVNEGEIEVDQAALTGESLPVTFYKGDSCKMGSTVVRGEVEGTVEYTGANTFFGKTASLLGETHEHSHLQKMLMTIMFVLVGLSVTLCIINLVYLITQGVEFAEALSFTIVLLVASIPLAIEIVTTTTLAIGSKKLSSHGAIVARLAAIEDLAGMSILCSDKTGTLTLNEMVLQDETPLYSDGVNQESVLVWAAIAAKWKEPARDALDRLTLGSVNMALLEHYEQLEYVPFDPTTKRTEGTVKDTRTGKEFKTSKGAPHIILNLLDPSDIDVREAVERDVALLGERGIRSLAVARTDDKGIWKMMGLLTFLDPPRPDTKQTIEDAVAYGISVRMLTGT